MGVFNIKGMGLMMDKFWMNPFTVNKRFSNVFQMSARFGETPFQPTHYINIRTWQWKSTMFHDGHRKWLSTWATSTTSTLTSCTTTAWPWDSPALRTSHCKGLQPPSPSIWSTGNLVVQTFEASVSEDKAWTLSLGSNRTTTWITWRTWPCDPCPGLLGSRHWPTDLTLWMKDGWTRLSPVQPHQREGLLGDQSRTDQTGGRDHRPTCPRWTNYKRSAALWEFWTCWSHDRVNAGIQGIHVPLWPTPATWASSEPVPCVPRSRWFMATSMRRPPMVVLHWARISSSFWTRLTFERWMHASFDCLCHVNSIHIMTRGHISPATCACGISTSRVGFISRSKLRMDPPHAKGAFRHVQDFVGRALGDNRVPQMWRVYHHFPYQHISNCSCGVNDFVFGGTCRVFGVIPPVIPYENYHVVETRISYSATQHFVPLISCVASSSLALQIAGRG